MSNTFFPTLPGLGWSVSWVPKFSTGIQTATSGKEYRSQMMSSPLYDIGLTYEVIEHNNVAQDLKTLFGFFLSRQGSFDSFLYNHPQDNAVVKQTIGTGDGANKNFQLVRSFGDIFVEPVQNLNVVTGVYVNDVLKTVGTDYTVSATGVVVFTTAPGAGISVTWTGSYYYRCRFTHDDLSFENFMKNLWALKKLELIGCLGTKI